MRDTVELLEAIGRDSTLRRASPEALAQVLEAADASAGLREFVANGDATALTSELGLTQMHAEHRSQTGCWPDEVEQPKQKPDEGDKDDTPDQDPDDTDNTSSN